MIASLNPIPMQSRRRRGAGRPRGVVALDHVQVISYNNEDGGNSLYFRVDKKSSTNNSRLVIKDQYNGPQGSVAELTERQLPSGVMGV